MTSAKSLLLASAALLVSGALAQAADLPLAEPVEYVRVCDAWGTGYFYMPGSQTCLQISGYVRADLDYIEPGARGDDAVLFGGRARLNFDARTQTEFGALRSYLRLQADWSNGPADFFVEQAFVQFAGMTAGRATSFFDFYANANVFDAVGGSDTPTGLLGYTATFGSGFSASLSIEDRSTREYNPVGAVDSVTGFPAGGFDYAGTSVPDVVANVKVEQAWGSAQLSGALHHLRDNSDLDGDGDWDGADDEYGFAVQLGATVKLPMLAEGDQLTLQGAYANGALAYLGLYNQFGVAPDDAALLGVGADLEPSDGFLIVGELLHYWTRSLRSALAASYGQADAEVTDLMVDDYKEYTVLANLVWSPVKDLDLGVEVLYTSVDAEIAGVDALAGSNDDAFRSTFRVQRAF